MKTHRFVLAASLALLAAACSGPYRSALPDDVTDDVVDAAKGCDRDEPAACAALGVAYWNGDGVARDIDAALPLLTAACEGGDTALCGLSEQVALRGAGTAESRFAAERCDRGDAAGCRDLGDAFWAGDVVTRDRDRGGELYARACREGDAAACTRTHELRLFEGADDGVRAAAHAFDRDDVSGCGALALAYFGRGDIESVTTGLALGEQACVDGATDVCAVLGAALFAGEGVAQDIDRGVRLLSRACAAGDADACARSHELRLGPAPTPEALAHARGCDRADVDACVELGRAWRDGNAGGRDGDLAAQLLQGGCSAGRAPACAELADLRREGYGGQATSAEVIALYEQACAGGEAQACFDLGMLYRTGDGVTRDALTAYRHWRTACEGGLQVACDALPGPAEQALPDTAPDRVRSLARQCDRGELVACTDLAGVWLRGAGVARDVAEGRRLLVLACFRGEQGACREVVYPGPCSETIIEGDGVDREPIVTTWDMDRLARDGRIEAPASAATTHPGFPTVPEGGALPVIDRRFGYAWERAIDPNFWAASIQVSHDAAARVVTLSDGGLVTRLIYDTDGRAERIEEPAGAEVRVILATWGPQGRLLEVSDSVGAAVITTSFEYDASGRVVRAVRTSGDGATTTTSTWDYTYTARGDLGEMVTVVEVTDSRGRVRSREYLQHRRIYDARGNLMRADIRNEERVVQSARQFDYSCFPGGI